MNPADPRPAPLNLTARRPGGRRRRGGRQALAALATALAVAGGSWAIGDAPSARLAGVPLAVGSGAPCAAPGTLPTPPSSFRHVIWIFEENQSASDVLGSAQAPYFNSVANQCGVATNWHNVSHDSLTNYIGALSGRLSGAPLLNQGRDCSPTLCPQPQNNLFHQLEVAGSTWKVYAESMPANCSSAITAHYFPKHAPAPYFTDVAAACPINDVPLSTSRRGGPTVVGGSLLTDLTANTFPSFALITPNICDSGHTVGGACPSGSHVAASDQWLAAWLPTILDSPVYTGGGTAVFITWDEGAGADESPAETCWNAPHANTSMYPSCSVPMLAISPYTPPSTSPTRFNHYNLLKATEAMLGVPALPSSGPTGGMATPNDARAAFNL